MGKLSLCVLSNRNGIPIDFNADFSLFVFHTLAILVSMVIGLHPPFC